MVHQTEIIKIAQFDGAIATMSSHHSARVTVHAVA